ncbi:ParB/RepB/Spo0J family partition protein [bacterium]|nr:ParB/RepB/Spo0J family partition protein [bacterium]
MAKNRGLGKGLDTILPIEIIDDILGEYPIDEKLREIPIEKIAPNPLQPREEFDEAGLVELANSIEAQGILQPILVAPDGENFIIVAGERRWRASEIAGLDKIPAIILSERPSEQQLLFLALVENLQRKDLDPIEEAGAYRMLAEKFGLTQIEIAERMGKSRPRVANAIRLLKLPEPILKFLRERKITIGHAIVLLEEKNRERQIRLARLTVRKGLSIERLTVLVMGKSRRKTGAKKRGKTPEILVLEEELSMALGTRVEIELHKKKSKLIIEFFTDEELEEIVNKLSE